MGGGDRLVPAAADARDARMGALRRPWGWLRGGAEAAADIAGVGGSCGAAPCYDAPQIALALALRRGATIAPAIWAVTAGKEIPMAVSKVLKGALAVFAVSVGTVPALAATEWITNATVMATQASEDSVVGGCVAQLDKSATQAVDCGSSGWVAFSCSGEHTSKATAMRLFDSAQMAMALGRTVRVEVDDSRKHGPFCFATRVRVMAAAPATP